MNIDKLKNMRDIENEEYLVWQITIQHAATGSVKRYIITAGFDIAFKLGRKLELEEFGEYILVKIENLTMTQSSYFLHIDK